MSFGATKIKTFPPKEGELFIKKGEIIIVPPLYILGSPIIH